MKALIAILTVLLLTACGPDLPPQPPMPGQAIHASVGGAIAGLASRLPTWAAEPHNIVLNPEEAAFGDGIILTISDYDYIYKNGYYFDTQHRQWKQFSIEGETIQNWIKNNGIATIPISESYFQAGENYLVVYACNKAGQDWDCNNNKWMVAGFNVLAPEIPEVQLENVEQYIINEPIQTFQLQSTGGEPDNFESIIVNRYDAKYRDRSQGLVVLTHIFEFETMADLTQTTSTLFKEIINRGWKRHAGNNLALFLDENDKRVAVWTSGKHIIYIETWKPEFASQEIINAYLQKYPSDLQKQ